MIVLYAGDNDLADGKTAAEVFEDYKKFVSKSLKSLPNVKIAFISIKPSPSRWKLVSEFRAANELIRQFDSANKNLVFIDIFDAMLGSDGKPRPELYINDGLHMSRQGYALWAKAVAPYLQ